MALGRDIADEALRHVGVREAPMGSDDTEFGQWAEDNGGKNHVAWCGEYVSYCVQVASGNLRAVCEGTKVPPSGYVEGGLTKGCFGNGGFAVGCDHVPTIERWGRAGMSGVKFIDAITDGTDEFQPGDILIIDVNEKKDHGTHTGIFVGFESDGVDPKAVVVSIEGNYSNKVTRVTRNCESGEILGACRLI